MNSMVKLSYLEDLDFRKWYCHEVLSVIKKKKITRVPDADKEFAHILNNLSDEEMIAIICKPRVALEKIAWIRDYLCLADFVGCYSIFKENCRKKQKKTMRRKFYLKRFKGKYLARIHCDDIELCCKSWSAFDKLKKEAKKSLDNLNDIIGQKINYEFLGQIKKDLFSKMDVKVCPYCNQQYIYYMDNNKYLGDIDHVLPQSIYKLFSLSIWNLVPSCKTCNQLFKHERVMNILNPTLQGFDSNAIFKLKFKNIASIRGEGEAFDYAWKIQHSVNGCTYFKIRNSIEMFDLNSLYYEHKNIIKNVLQKKYNFDERFVEDYRNRLKICSDDELNYSIYGCSLNPKKFKDEILSKMIYDIVKKN